MTCEFEHPGPPVTEDAEQPDLDHRDVLLGGESVRLSINDHARQLRGETSYTMWNDVYTQARLAELAEPVGQRIAAE